MRGVVCALLCFLYFSCVFGATCPDKISGIVKWSQWPNKPTASGSDVVIAKTDVILFDESPIYINHIDVYGTLVVSPDVANFELNVSSVYVRNGGIFYAGSEACPLSNTVTITLFGVAKKDVDPAGLGTKVLGVLNGGTLEIHGKTRKPVWTVLGQTANINDTQITLADAVDWNIGDRILIATTDYETNINDNPAYQTEQSEVRVITRKPADNIVGFDTPLSFMHYGKIWTGSNGDTIDMRGEVGILNRNIIIKGDLDSDLSAGARTAKWGGHVMIRDGGVGRIEYAEVFDLGQSGEFGRYPLHFHNSSVQPNSYLRGNSIHDTFQRCIVVHSTFNLRVQNNIAYRGMGHCYFIEDGNEEQNVFEHNLGVKALVGTLLTADSEPAMYWITNPNNHFYNNRAAGGKFGFWYVMPETPLALAAAEVTNKLRYKIAGDFIGNTAHSCNDGIFVDRGLENAKPGSANGLTSYMPTNWTASMALAKKMGKDIDVTVIDEYTLATLGFRTPATFVDFTAYKCSEHGMWGRGSFMHSYGAKFADNTIGCIWPGNANLMQKTVMVGETDNIGNYNTVPRNRNWWGDEEGRSRPSIGFLEQPIVGYSSYDAAGGDIAIDINFHNYNDYTFTEGRTAGKIRKSGALSGLIGPNVIEPTNRIYRANFFNVQNRVYIRQYYPWYPDLAKYDDAMKGIVWVDGDGSILAGLPEAGCGKQVVGTSPHVRTTGCVEKKDWNAWICPANQDAHRAFYVSQERTVTSSSYNKTLFREETDLHVRRLGDGASVDIEANIRDRSTYFTAQLSYGTNLVVNKDYYLTYGNSNKFLGSFRFQVNLMLGEKIRFAIPITGTRTVTVTSGWDGSTATTQVDSIGKLERNTYYFDTTAGILWIHLELSPSQYNTQFYYTVPIASGNVLYHVKTDCTSECTYSSTSIPSASGVTGAKADLCETGGKHMGGSVSYTQKSTTSFTIFDNDFAAGWYKGNDQTCNITTQMVYSGNASLVCVMGNYQWFAFSKVWSVANINAVVNPALYTHLEFAIRLAEGYGNDLQLSVMMFNRSYTKMLGNVKVHNPRYTNDNGPITDQKWSVVRIPIGTIATEEVDMWGIAFQSNLNRYVPIYLDAIQMVNLNEQTGTIAGYPAAPSKPTLRGPGPQFSYGGTTDPEPEPTSPPTSDGNSSGTTGGPDSQISGGVVSSLSYVVFMVVVAAAMLV